METLSNTLSNGEKDEITIIYKLDNRKVVKIFGKNFVKINKDKCKIIYNSKEYELTGYFNLGNKIYYNLLTIKLRFIHNIIKMSDMFNECSSLLSLPDIYKWNTNNVKNLNYLFCDCSLLKTLPDISKWKIGNVNSLNLIFYNCISLYLIPDISKWNTKNIH